MLFCASCLSLTTIVLSKKCLFLFQSYRPGFRHACFSCILSDIYFVFQSLEFAAQPGQSAAAVLMMRNAGSIVLDVSLELQHYADLFTVTPEQCEIEPGGLSEVCIHFSAPDNPAASVYSRCLMHKFCGSFIGLQSLSCNVTLFFDYDSW